MEWQPIETAPKDGRFVIWLADEGFPVLASYRKFEEDDEKTLWIWEMGESAEWHDPTHWMPLPEPPK